MHIQRTRRKPIDKTSEDRQKEMVSDISYRIESHLQGNSNYPDQLEKNENRWIKSALSATMKTPTPIPNKYSFQKILNSNLITFGFR